VIALLTRENVGSRSNEQVVTAGALFYPTLAARVIEIALP